MRRLARVGAGELLPAVHHWPLVLLLTPFTRSVTHFDSFITSSSSCFSDITSVFRGAPRHGLDVLTVMPCCSAGLNVSGGRRDGGIPSCGGSGARAIGAGAGAGGGAGAAVGGADGTADGTSAGAAACAGAGADSDGADAAG